MKRTPITLSGAEARAVYGILVRELEAPPLGEELFVDCCGDGRADEITFLGSRSAQSWAGSRGRKLTVETSRFTVVAGPLHVVCSEDDVSSEQLWAAEDASAWISVALAELAEPTPFCAFPRERLSALAA